MSDAAPGSQPAKYPLRRANLHYAHSHPLQTVDITLPRPLAASAPSRAVWVVFLHGGAWVDPGLDASELRPAIELLLAGATDDDGEPLLDRVAGFASLNYGLSPRPGDVRDELPVERQATHPAHLRDVLAGLRRLRVEYGVGGRMVESESAAAEDGQGYDGYDWIAVGHSCGATMLFQLAMGLMAGEDGRDPFGLGVAKPVALVGLAGIYDLPLLVRSHEDPYYRAFVGSAFGADEAVWAAVSPVAGSPRDILEAVDVVVVAQSKGDTLVEMQQGEDMRARLSTVARSGQVLNLELTGGHDAVWYQGKGVVSAITLALNNINRT